MKNKLGEYFSWDEMTYSRIGVENGIDNTPGEAACEALRHLVAGLLDPLRRLYGKPMAVTSGYRCEKVNRLAGGVADSQHMKGEAADCYVPDTGELLEVLQKSGLVFDQAIHYRKRHFLHLSLKRSGRNRMQVLVRLVVSAFLLSGLLSGCSVRRESSRRESAVRTDSIRFASRSTSRKERWVGLLDTVYWQVRQVVYSAPDSSGCQYPMMVTELQMDRYRRLTDTGNVVVRQEVAYAEENTERADVRAESRRKIRPPAFLFCGALLVGIAGIFLYNRYKGVR